MISGLINMCDIYVNGFVFRVITITYSQNISDSSLSCEIKKDTIEQPQTQ